MNIPDGAYLKEISAHYNRLTIPRHLLAGEPLPPEIWGKVIVESGEVELLLENASEKIFARPTQPAIIPTGTRFQLEPKGRGIQFYLQYFHEPKLDAEQLAGSLGRRPPGRKAAK